MRWGFLAAQGLSINHLGISSRVERATRFAAIATTLAWRW